MLTEINFVVQGLRIYEWRVKVKRVLNWRPNAAHRNGAGGRANGWCRCLLSMDIIPVFEMLF